MCFDDTFNRKIYFEMSKVSCLDDQKDKQNDQKRQVKLQQRHSLCLLEDQGALIAQLTSNYHRLKRQIDKNYSLQQLKQEMQKVKLTSRMQESKQTQNLNKRVQFLRDQCSNKERQLASTKQELISNAIKIKDITKQSQYMRQIIEQKQQEWSRLQEVKKQKVLSNNHLESTIKKVNTKIKQQMHKKLKLKQQLMQIRQQGLNIRSGSDLKAMISKSEQQSSQMQSMLKDMVKM